MLQGRGGGSWGCVSRGGSDALMGWGGGGEG